MAFKGILNEVGRQIEKKLNQHNQGGQGQGGNQRSDPNLLIQNLLGFLGKSGKSGHSSTSTTKNQDYLNTILNLIQTKGGGRLSTEIARYLPAINKIADIISHGLGDDSPRTQKNSDGTIIDNFRHTEIDGRRIYGGGGGSYYPQPPPPLPFAAGTGIGSDFYHQTKAQCLSRGQLFEDREFPAVPESVFFSERERRNFEWLRPHEIVSNPSFFVDGVSRFDVIQGELGDCWLLAAIANLTLYPNLFHQVVPQDNSLQRGNYAGIFHFRFWQYGKWVEVVVDDRLPTSRGKLLFMHSASRNEFWSALLEKAYAKLHGSYEALRGGTTCEAQEDFTGGLTEIYEIGSIQDSLLNMMLSSYERGSLLGCSIEPDANIREAETRTGLIRGHAYAITAVKLVDIATPRTRGKIPLIRIRNPWGNHKEWKGAWSDGSEEWRFIDNHTKAQLGLTFDPDGEFWMSFQDFCQHFDQLEICHLSPDSPHDANQKMWDMKGEEGAWIFGQSAGGCRNFLETFVMNPQHVVDLTECDKDDPEGKCTLIVALMQKNRRALKKYGGSGGGGSTSLTIGFALYRVNEQEGIPLRKEFFKYNASTARSPTFINLREVCSRFKLKRGRYVVVPSTYEPGEEGEYLLRIFKEVGGNSYQNQYQAPPVQQNYTNPHPPTAPSSYPTPHPPTAPSSYPTPHPPTAPSSYPTPHPPTVYPAPNPYQSPATQSYPPNPSPTAPYPMPINNSNPLPYPTTASGMPYPPAIPQPYANNYYTNAQFTAPPNPNPNMFPQPGPFLNNNYFYPPPQ